MKVIDLLNKVANGEEVPKKIRYKGLDFIYNTELNDYMRDDDFYETILYNVLDLHGNFRFDNILNDEVEIIEDSEEKEIQIEKLNYDIRWDNDITDKVNELVDKVNELSKEQIYDVRKNK